ncbi:transposase [Arthrobacter sp.]|uniref:IS110 family transposase n=1 Tax=Arthrobacter sp. TaxID=1667 RepID=UPI002899922C|nr:transposase [Arthrobacter sp.]
MRRVADLRPDQAKSDARDAAIIAEASRSMLHALYSVERDDETLTELGVFCGFDDDVAGQITATSNRIPGLLAQIHPSLERALGPHLDHPAVAGLITRFLTPQALKTAGLGHVRAKLKKYASRAAPDQQRVAVVGIGAADIVLPSLPEQLMALRRQSRSHPRSKLSSSPPSLRDRDVYARHRPRDLRTVLNEVTGKQFDPPLIWLPTPESPRLPAVPEPRSAVSPRAGWGLRSSTCLLPFGLRRPASPPSMAYYNR